MLGGPGSHCARDDPAIRDILPDWPLIAFGDEGAKDHVGPKVPGASSEQLRPRPHFNVEGTATYASIQQPLLPLRDQRKSPADTSGPRDRPRSAVCACPRARTRRNRWAPLRLDGAHDEGGPRRLCSVGAPRSLQTSGEGVCRERFSSSWRRRVVGSCPGLFGRIECRRCACRDGGRSGPSAASGDSASGCGDKCCPGRRSRRLDARGGVRAQQPDTRVMPWMRAAAPACGGSCSIDLARSRSRPGRARPC